MKWRRCWGNVAHQSDHRPVCSIEHARFTRGKQPGSATFCSDQSYILIISESHILVVSELLWPSRWQILTLSLVFSGSGSCVPHLKVVDWMASGSKWIGIGTGSQILFVLLQTPAQCSPTITHFNWLCFTGMDKKDKKVFTKILATILLSLIISAFSSFQATPPCTASLSFSMTRKLHILL